MSPFVATGPASPMAAATGPSGRRNAMAGALVAARMDLFAISGSMRRYLLTIIPLALVFGVLVGSIPATGVISSLVLSAAIMAAQWDGQAGWEGFKASLPISRRQIVAGRYLAMLVFGAVDLALVLATSAIAWAIATSWPAGLPGNPGNGTLGFGEVLSGALMVFTCMMLCTAVVLPLFLRFGTTESLRWIVVLCVVGVVVSVMALEDAPVGLVDILSLDEQGLLALCAGTVCICWFASYRVAVALYQSKAL